MTARVPHPSNVPGDFFVEDGCCMSCLVPVEDVPEMLKYDEQQSHCFVHRQPGTAEEVDRMLAALRMSEVRCIHYAGSDPAILAHLAAKGEASQCSTRLDEAPQFSPAAPPPPPPAPHRTWWLRWLP